MKSNKFIVLFTLIVGISGIILGAFGAHGLKNVLEPEALASFEVGVRYSIYISLFVLALSLVSEVKKLDLVNANWVLLIGGLLFSYSIFGLQLFKHLNWGYGLLYH